MTDPDYRPCKTWPPKEEERAFPPHTHPGVLCDTAFCGIEVKRVGGHYEQRPLTADDKPTDVVATPRRVPTRFVAYDEFGNFDTYIGLAGR
jgi:hypothetical protein